MGKQAYVGFLFRCYSKPEDEAFGIGLDEDLASALEFIQDISDTRSFAILDDPDRAGEFRELLSRIDRRNALLGRTFKRQKVNERLRRDETSEQFQRLMADHGITCSMSRSGNVWDNAAMEELLLVAQDRTDSPQGLQNEG